MNLNNDSYKRKARWLVGIITVCILIYLCVQNIGVVAGAVSWIISLVMPLILGIVFALIFNVPMSFFEKHFFKNSHKAIFIKLRRPVSYLLSILLVFGIMSGLVVLVIPELINAIKLLVKTVIEFITKIDTLNLSQIPFSSTLLDIDWKKISTSLEVWLKEESSSIMNTAVGTIGTLLGGIVNFFIAFIFSIYILFNKEKLKNQATRLIDVWFPKKFGKWLIHAFKICSKVFRNFVSGQTLEAIILGFLCMIGMLILGIPYAPMIGALVGVTAIIPVVGAFIGAIVGAFMIFTVSPIKAVVFIIFLVVLQQLEGNLIYPKVMGSRVNLPAMWVLAAVTIGGGIAGPLGMLIGVPAMSVVYILVREATQIREAKLKENTNDS